MAKLPASAGLASSPPGIRRAGLRERPAPTAGRAGQDRQHAAEEGQPQAGAGLGGGAAKSRPITPVSFEAGRSFRTVRCPATAPKATRAAAAGARAPPRAHSHQDHGQGEQGEHNAVALEAGLHAAVASAGSVSFSCSQLPLATSTEITVAKAELSDIRAGRGEDREEQRAPASNPARGERIALIGASNACYHHSSLRGGSSSLREPLATWSKGLRRAGSKLDGGL